MAGSSVWRPFWHRFHSKIVPEGMQNDVGRATERLREGLGSSGAAFWAAHGKTSHVFWEGTARRAGLLEVFDFD